MAANVWLKTLTLTPEYQALSATPLILDATIIVNCGPLAPVASATMRIGSTTVQLVAGNSLTLKGVDLSTIEFAGESTYTVTVIAQVNLPGRS